MNLQDLEVCTLRIKFVGIRIHNFLSIADESINLEDMGFTIVTGINNRKTDNASSNGSGKSSIFNAKIDISIRLFINYRQ